MTIKPVLSYILIIASASLVEAAPQDAPIPPARAVSMLGKGIVIEPQSGDINKAISAKYIPLHGEMIKKAGFKSVRIRYQGDKNPIMQTLAHGPPYDEALIKEQEDIIDDLLKRNLAVVITIYGLTKDKPGDLKKMTQWWGYIANRFKNKSHRLVFNLFVEPADLLKNKDPHRIFDYYQSITRAIRKTNPTRLIIYYRVPPRVTGNKSPAAFKPEDFMTQQYNPIPKEAGIYYLIDFHNLKPNVKDKIRKVDIAFEYMNKFKEPLWCGAWGSKNSENELWVAIPMATEVTKRFIEHGIPYTYLMMYDGMTGIYDAGKDLDGNGIINEWRYPDILKAILAGPDIWWNLLNNPGFEQGLDHWQLSGNKSEVTGTEKEHYIEMPSGSAISQDVTLALQHNGPGQYSILFKASSSSAKIEFIIEGSTAKSHFKFMTKPLKITGGKPQMHHLKINLPWKGTLRKADLTIKITGGKCYLDKLGLTMLFDTKIRISSALWPGEKKYPIAIQKKSNFSQDINVTLRKVVKENARKGGDSFIINQQKTIDNIREKIKARQIKLLGDDVVNSTTKGDRSKKKVDWISKKDNELNKLTNQLKTAENRLRDYLLIHNMEFRRIFYDVYHNYPPGVEQKFQ